MIAEAPILRATVLVVKQAVFLILHPEVSRDKSERLKKCTYIIQRLPMPVPKARLTSPHGDGMRVATQATGARLVEQAEVHFSTS